jgi:hypothetical protein
MLALSQPPKLEDHRFRLSATAYSKHQQLPFIPVGGLHHPQLLYTICGENRDMRHVWVFVTKPNGKRLLRRFRRRWEDNIKLELREIRRLGMDWCSVAGSCEYGNELTGSICRGQFISQIRNYKLSEGLFPVRLIFSKVMSLTNPLCSACRLSNSSLWFLKCNANLSAI